MKKNKRKQTLFSDIVESFDMNQRSVTELINFDRIILDFSINRLKEFEEVLIKHHFSNPLWMPTKTIKALNTIRENDSMRTQYESIFNQCLVLSVSYFSSTVGSIFKRAINHTCHHLPELLSAGKEDIKISFDELKQYNFNLSETMGDLIVKKKDITFQDMQSTHREFKTFLGIDIERDKTVNTIIFAQASRHVIVHALSTVDDRFVYQIREASPRDLKPEISFGDKISFTPNEVEIIQLSMKLYITRLVETIENRMKAD